MKRCSTSHSDRTPFGGQFTIACGLATAIDFLQGFNFTDAELAYLGSQRGNDGKPLFGCDFSITCAMCD
jgi:nicotinate phosphoribosyltransferase